jgi:hypothetical protein
MTNQKMSCAKISVLRSSIGLLNWCIPIERAITTRIAFYKGFIKFLDQKRLTFLMVVTNITVHFVSAFKRRNSISISERRYKV